MNIIDQTPRYHDIYFQCLEDWSDEIIDTSDRDVFLTWGISDAIFVDDKRIGAGPPLSYAKIKQAIHKRVKHFSE